jgi:glycerol-3-phosphate dehydrogenase
MGIAQRRTPAVIRGDDAGASVVHDVLVIGGGICGAGVLDAATRGGMRACLFEARDFGSGATRNSLRILHGGLRYLQTLDLRRTGESIAACREIAGRFPALVRPLPCLMPLYGTGLRRRPILRAAFAAHALVSRRGAADVPAELRLAAGETLSASETLGLFPGARTNGLVGGALWHEYHLTGAERIVIELLRNACALGAVARNYSAVDRLVVVAGKVTGAVVRDVASGETREVRARAVVDCSGSAAGTLEPRDTAGAPIPRALAFNVLLDRSTGTELALAVAAPAPRTQVLFVVPQARAVLAGTMHVARAAGGSAEPSREEIERYLDELRAALPSFGVRNEGVCRILSGLLPARAPESAQPASRDVLIDHGARGGVRGLFTVSGVKYTTALKLAQRVVSRLKKGREAGDEPVAAMPVAEATPLLLDASRLWHDGADQLGAVLRETVAAEAVRSLDDLIMGRSNWGATEPDLARLRRRLAELLPELATKMTEGVAAGS